MRLLSLALVLLALCSSVSCRLRHPFRRSSSSRSVLPEEFPSSHPADQFPTPYQIQSLPGLPQLLERQFTGYLPISSDPSAPSLFFWFVESRRAPSTDPLVLWLTGGPFCSSELGMFWEIGPYRPEKNQTLSDNPNAWNQIANVLFIDQPLGTGFSVSGQPNFNASIPTSMEQSTQQLYYALQQFYQLFPQFEGREFFLTGESYAGKYIPYLATAIMNGAGVPNTPVINLQGIACGDCWSQPLQQTAVYGDQAYNFAIIDENGLEYVNQQYSICSGLVNSQNWSQAQVVCDGLLNWIVQQAGNIDVDDLRIFGSDEPDPRLEIYLNTPQVQKAIGFSEPMQWLECSAYTQLATDEMKPSSTLWPALWMKYHVVFYSGAFDLNCGPVGTQRYLRDLLGDGIYLSAQRRIWYQNNQVQMVPSGYAKDFIVPGAPYNVSYVIVADAGHMVPQTESRHSLDLINRVINYLPF